MRNAKPTGDYLKKKTLKGLDLLPPPKGSWTLILGQALKRCFFVCLQWAGVILISYGCTSSTSLKSVEGANLCSSDEAPGCIAPASIGCEPAAHAGGPEADTMSCSHASLLLWCLSHRGPCLWTPVLAEPLEGAVAEALQTFFLPFHLKWTKNTIMTLLEWPGANCCHQGSHHSPGEMK